MEKGKLIVIEGTDCSGKETQTQKLINYLESQGKKVKSFSFPMYDTPTGKIIGGPLLGKEYICDGWFPEGATHVDGNVAALYYAADRYYNIHKIMDALNEGYTVILDRYIYSNMGHQAGKLAKKEERLERYKFIEKLEFDLLQLPKPDGVILLFMPVQEAKIIRAQRPEKLDQAESDEKHLMQAQNAYLEMAELYNFNVINCAINGNIRTIDEISKDVIKAFEKING
ncbi:MAG: hypothetical protein E7164_01610 [Firmicutes bacterium]|nr:hypothetical protein [Bacillota bacterium]